MASLKFRHYATESALIGSNTLQVALNAMDVGDIVFIDDTQKQYIITSKNNNVVTYSIYYGKAAITGVTGTGATRTLTFSDGSEITITIDNVKHAITSESCSGNANSATTLQNTRKINGTNFNGSVDITTNNWGTSRNIGIVNSDGSGTATPVSINGSNDINLKLPSTIKANLEGNASTANTAISAGSANTATNATNADLLDNQHLITQVSDWGTDSLSIFKSSENSISNAPTSDFIYGVTLRFHRNMPVYHTDLVVSLYHDRFFFRRKTEEGYQTWRELIHDGNIGSQSVNYATTSGACTGNAATATKLQTARKIWGQSFDGSGNISGSLEIFSTGSQWNEGIRIHPSPNGWSSIVLCESTNSSSSGTSANTWSIHNYEGTFGIYKKGSTTSASCCISNIDSNWVVKGNNVGIGTTSPTSKLHVAGTGYFTSDVSSASNIIAGGYIKGETVKISSGCTLQYDSTQKCVKFVF